MNVFNYVRALGAFLNGSQLIRIAAEPADRQDRKMLAEAFEKMEAHWVNREAFFEKRILAGDEYDIDAEKKAFFPVAKDGFFEIQLQFLQDFMIRNIAGAQNNVSIHDAKAIAELRAVLDEFKVKTYSRFKGVTFDKVNWTANGQQKPKLLIHLKKADAEHCIRLEAATELCPKFIVAALEMNLVPGDVFDLEFKAEDPAIYRNQQAGKKVAEVGKYVNHNIKLTKGSRYHTGRQTGRKFEQKQTIEVVEAMYRQLVIATSLQTPRAA